MKVQRRRQTPHATGLRRPFDAATSAAAVAGLVVLLLGTSELGDRAPLAFLMANLAVLGVFAVDIVARFVTSPDKRAHLRGNWLDFVVLLPLLQYVGGVEDGPWSVGARQAAILVMLFTRTRRVQRLFASFALNPAQLMVLTFLGAIYVGTVLLMLPAATASGQQAGLVDAFFTATSATCVTGLIVVDTATHFSRFGQLVILGLIQTGGLGIMTFSVSLALLAGREVRLKQQAAMQDIMDQERLAGIRRLVLFIVGLTALAEAVGACVLFFAWTDLVPEAGPRLYHACFHAVSAFCNAGFSTFSDSLVRFRAHAATNITVCLLIVCGGLGFSVFRDLGRFGRERWRTRGRRHLKLSVQTQLALGTSLLLIGLGAATLTVFEARESFQGLSMAERGWSAFFQSVSTRTAGFNTCDIGALSSATLVLMMVLMFIGASPGSTGGGVKTTTVAVISYAVRANLTRRQHVEVCGRTLPWEVLQKAITVLALSLATVGVFAVALLYTESQPIGDILFETVSAFGTVGLSTGITPELTMPGRILVALLMFVGRLGPLTIAYSLVRFRRPARYRYAEERVMIG